MHMGWLVFHSQSLTPSTNPQSILYSSNSIELQFAQHVVRRLVEAGYIAYFAGGCVRDALLGREPHDFDVATNATTAQVRMVFGESQTRAVGEAFGVVIVHGRLRGTHCQVEVATFRSDGVYSDGRRPDWVVFSTPEHDAQRRDFTINGLFYDPIEARVIDYVGGQQDLQAGVLRAIGDPHARIREDKLRMLRAIRFAGRFQLELDPTTKNALEHAAPGIVQVSGERTGMELKKILEHPSRAWAWEQLIETGLAFHLVPELHARWESQAQRSIELQTLATLPNTPIRFPIAMSALVHPWYDEQRNAAGLEKLLQVLQERWKLSNAEIDAARFALLHADDLIAAKGKPWSTVQPLLTSRSIEDALTLAEAIAVVRSMDLEGVLLCRERLNQRESVWNPQPLICGSDLIALGLRPGPAFADILAQARAMQLDGQLDSKADANAWLDEVVRRLPESS